MSIVLYILRQTCCPQYTIRLQVDRFSPSKSQSQLLRRFDEKLRLGDAFTLKSCDARSNTSSTALLAQDTGVGANSELLEEAVQERVTLIERKRQPNAVTVETVSAQYTQEVFEL